jgi:T4 RnlA family RNA ligase
MDERICLECRGLILDENSNWSVVSRPFDKFFNYGEGRAAEIDWATASVQEKIDGSLMTLYHYDGKWHVASSGSPDATGSISELECPKTFAEHFWTVFKRIASIDMLPMSSEHCFMFEMVGPLNRVVVKHPASRLILIGARNIKTGQELMPIEASEMLPSGFEVVRSYPLISINNILSNLEKMNPIEQEGYVVVDAAFNRIKCKCPAYVAIHHARGNQGVNPKKLLSIAVAGESDEWACHFEDDLALLGRIRLTLKNFISSVCEDYSRIMKEIGPNGTRKDFALLAVKCKCPGALFAYYSGKCDSVNSYVCP